MNAWERDNVDYDVLGASSYAFWAGKNMLENVRKAGEYVASRGKLFAVLETSWLNSQKDADGTVNMVNNTNGAVYKVGPQGQADMLSDLYNAILSNDNGLGAFYWEGAWIPVRAGWVNWKYNKEMANEFGTGWAQKMQKDIIQRVSCIIMKILFGEEIHGIIKHFLMIKVIH